MSRWKPEPIEKRFWKHAVIVNPEYCWMWTASLGEKGYGQFNKGNGRTVRAHRLAYELTFGPIPAGRSVLHRCDHASCVNPYHLFLGTQAENMTDMVRKGRHSSLLDPNKVRSIRLYRSNKWKCSKIAEHFCVSVATIKAVLSRRLWAHVE